MPTRRNYRTNPYYVPKPPVPDPSPSSSALTRFQPPPTPIYPKPVPPPIALPRFPSPPPALSGFVPKALAAGKAAASFKAPPGLGAVARKVGGFAGRAFPGIGWAFFALDAFLLSCAAGLLPFSICQRPDNPSPGGKTPGFSGGQCFGVLYIVSFRYERPGEGFDRDGGNLQTRNRIDGMVSENTTTNVIWRLKTTQLSGAAQFYDVLASQLGTVCRIVSIVRQDGGIDNCGNPQPQPEPREPPDVINNFNNHHNNININITLPSALPPSPLPKRAPNIIAPPSPLPNINISNSDYHSDGGNGDPDLNLEYIVAPSPGGNYNDYPDIFNNFPPAPSPRPKAPDPFPRQNPPPNPAPQLQAPPEIPPPLPDRLPPDSTEEDKYIYRQNKETLDKVYKANAEILEIQKEQKKQGKILENIQGLLDFEVQGSQLITRCDDIDIFYSYKGKILEAINQQLNQVKIIEQTIISEICQVEASAAVAAPDWWAVRLGGDTPQLALIFRVTNTRTYHTLVVPHPINTAPLTTAPIPSYKKGNWMGMITCKDNSKFVCNCGTKGEATRLLFIAASLIDPIFLGDPVRFYYAERKGGAVSEGDMRGTSAQYFPIGQRQTKPLWRVTFTRDGQ